MHFALYIRRSYRRLDSAAVSDETQEAMARATLPPGATCEVIRDSGGHRSGATTERDGYQELLVKLRSGAIDGIAVYDLSRLHRNAANMLALHGELERRSVALLVATMPTTRFDTAIGRYMFGQLALAAQLQRDLDSERMVSLTRSIFESGGHRGLDPFGYVTALGIRPRTLEIVHSEAETVRRIWSELANLSCSDIADRLNRDGIPHRIERPWTRNAVKDIVRRGRFYLGYVTHRRGEEERPGTHPAILDELTWREASTAARARVRGSIRRGSRHRIYLLSGLLRCGECDARMHGQASVSRGLVWRRYICRDCGAPSVPAEQAEAELRTRIAGLVLPERVIDRTRELLRSELSIPRDVGRDRRRLEQRRDRLGQMYAWGDLTPEAYRAQRAAVQREIDLLPSPDGLLLFDRNRRLMVSMAESAATATPAQMLEIARLLIAEAAASERSLGDIWWTPPARPFFLLTAPPDGLEPPKSSEFAYYLRAG